MAVQVLHGCDAGVARVSVVEVVQPLALLPVPETTHTPTHTHTHTAVTAGRGHHRKPQKAAPCPDQMLSLSATAMQLLKGWNLTTDGTPGFRLMKIWSSSRGTPGGRAKRSCLSQQVHGTLTQRSLALARFGSGSRIKLPLLR